MKSYAAVGSVRFLLATKSFIAANNRLHASAQSNNNVSMMTSVDNQSVLMVVSKDNGTTVSKVALARRDHQPLYKVDQPTGLVFYAPKAKNLLGWTTKDGSISCFKTSGSAQ